MWFSIFLSGRKNTIKYARIQLWQVLLVMLVLELKIKVAPYQKKLIDIDYTKQTITIPR